MLPQDLCNRSLDSIGVPIQIGAFTDGTDQSEACRRIYYPTLLQLLRTANWQFARKMAALQLLGDATGQTLDPLGNPLPTAVDPPWVYCYAWPIDGVRARWLPWQIPPAPGGVPTLTNLQTGPYSGLPSRPAPFLVASSDQYPVVVGSVPWDQLPDFSTTQGVGAISRRVVLTNVQNAQLVYTKLVLELEEWDGLFEQAMVATIASRLAMILIQDKKLAMAERAQQTALAQQAVREARTVNANDAGYPQNISYTPDFIRVRTGGASRWNVFPGYSAPDCGYLSLGWASMSWADGSVY